MNEAIGQQSKTFDLDVFVRVSSVSVVLSATQTERLETRICLPVDDQAKQWEEENKENPEKLRTSSTVSLKNLEDGDEVENQDDQASKTDASSSIVHAVVGHGQRDDREE